MSLEITNLTKKFDTTFAVNNLSLSIPEGEIIGFLGSNGAGKTTTFRMILGLLTATSGEIKWDNQKVGDEMLNNVGYLPEERGLYPKLTVKEQIHYLGSLKGMIKKDLDIQLEYWLSKFEIEQYLKRPLEELSKGNQQKVQLITSIIHKPKLLILDEPFTGLDPVNVKIFKEAVIEAKNNGTAIVFSSHRMDHVEELCEKICILKEGKPISQGKIKEIKDDFSIKNLIISGDYNFKFLQSMPGVIKYEEYENEIRIQIENESYATRIYDDVIKLGFLRKFELKSPTLEEIFVSKVGEVT